MAAERIDSLTGLRFFAAFGILVHHFGSSLACGSPRLEVFLESLSSCVSFFFVLSGFILVHSYQATTRRLEWRAFMAARIARIYPLYLLALLVMSVPFLKYPVELPDWKPWEALPAYLASLFAVQSWIPRYSMLLNSPGWSLSAEMFFYAVFPIVAWRWRSFLFGRPLAAMSLFWVVSCLLGLILEATGIGDRSVSDSGAKFAGFHPLVRLPEFLMGMSLAALHSRRLVSG
ncbi:MAG TPA: acyltransferase, partial [Fibrobacteria bacterium]|nr:acyltransferase [Fibrobacteria bacterium]